MHSPTNGFWRTIIHGFEYIWEGLQAQTHCAAGFRPGETIAHFCGDVVRPLRDVQVTAYKYELPKIRRHGLVLCVVSGEE